MTKLNRFYVFIVAMLITQAAFADDYKQYAQTVRDSIWAWDKAEFKNYNVPEKYKDESAVILALHEEVYATGSTRIRYTGRGLLGFGLNKELNYMHVFRKMIKLNDKKALADNAEIQFKESDKTMGYYSKTIYKNVIGVRVIKPNGTIKEVDINEAVSITEGKKDKESNKKLAVSDLEVGDILDFFYHEEGRIDYMNIPEQVFTFASKYPILSYSVHCELSKNMTNEYRLLNGAPDFTQSTNEDGDIVLDVKQTDIAKTPESKWLSPYRQFPTIRLCVLYNSNKKIYKPLTARGKGLHKNLPPEQILKDAMHAYNGSSYYLAVKTLNKRIKKHLKKNPSLDKKQLAEYINLTLTNEVQLYNTIRYKTYISTLGALFSKYKIDYKFGFVTDRFDTRNQDAIAYWDYFVVLVANQDSQVFGPPRYRYHIGPYASYEGETVQMVTPKTFNTINFSNLEKRQSEMVIPVSSADQNMNKTEMTVRLAEDNSLTLDINRRTLLSGHQANGRYSDLITAADWRDSVHTWLGEKTYMETLLVKAAKNKKEIESHEASLAKIRKEKETEAKDEIKSYHDLEVKELKEHSFSALGVTPDSPQMIYDVKYTLDGLVKRAGNNYILDAGKLIGSQLTLDESNQQRTLDIYMPYARSYEHEIKLEIPAGYTAENIQTLNQNVDNACGAFISSADIDGSTLRIKAKKIYKHNYEPAANWNKLVEMIDAANNFYGQSIILKKK